MKNRYWIAILAAVLILCGLLSVWLLRPDEAAVAQIYSNGQLVAQLRLSQDQTFTVTTPEGGENLIMVQDGSIAVTEASCPDHYCVRRGFCQGGREIVCLPNRLVIRFVTEGEVDGETG